MHLCPRPRIKAIMLFDLHNDLLTADGGSGRAAYKQVYSLYGAVLVWWATEKAGLPPPQAVPRRHNLLFAVEDMHFFRPDMAEALALYRPAYCGLTWNYDNEMGGGAYGESGLTPLGRETISILNALGIAVDGAHLNRKSFFEAAERADRFLVSHTFISEAHAHPRNIDLAMVRAVADKRGVVGLTPITAFTGGGEESFLRGMDMLLSYAPEAAAIGTDLNGSTDFPEGLADYRGYARLRKTLFARGITAETADNIYYKNAARFFAAGESNERRLRKPT